uniref:Secreted protein n=1 Tax=Arundo donax TaxID=35708 RepID=A0A0A9GSN4_ARUDO
MVQTTVLPVLTVFLTVLITIAAARASRPEVGSSIKMIEGLATSSTAIVSLLRCSVDRPFTPGSPTSAPLNDVSSTRSMTSSMNIFLVSKSTSEGRRSHAENKSDSYTVTCGE